MLDEKSSQLLAIAFSRLPPPEQLATVLRALEGFPECLPAEAVMSLHAAASEQHEVVEQLRQLDIGQQELAQLDMPERYLWVLGTVPHCTAKLACGALIVGPARELSDLRGAAERVAVCCQAIRNSALVQRTVSTSLAVGNFMNRGTSRSNARAVVLPDSLLKFDELRGLQDAEDSGNEQKAENSANRGPTLLDFVAQALADEEFLAGAAERRMPMDLKAEAEALRAKALAAKSVCLDEAEANCKQICLASNRAREGLAQLSTGPATQLTDRVRSAKDDLGDRVRHVCEETEEVATRVRNAKEDLAITQQWSSTKGNPKGEDWFGAWAQFFEQLAAAFARTKPPRPAAMAAAAASAASVVPAAPAASAAPRPALGELQAPSAPPQVQASSTNSIKQCDVGGAPKLTKPHLEFGIQKPQPQQTQQQQQRPQTQPHAQPLQQQQQQPPPSQQQQPSQQPPSQQHQQPQFSARCPAMQSSGQRGAVMLDDDARVEDIGAFMELLKHPGAAAFQSGSRPPCMASGKENARFR